MPVNEMLMPKDIITLHGKNGDITAYTLIFK